MTDLNRQATKVAFLSSDPSLIYIALSSTLLTLTVSACAPKPPEKPQARPALVAQVEGGATSEVLVTGLVRSTSNQEIPSEYGGKIIALRTHVGDRVEAGQIVAELDSSVARLQASQAQAQLRQAAADLDAAHREKARIEALVNAGAASSQDLDNAITALRRAEAQKQASAAQAGLADRALGKTQIRAPENGVIATRHVELGSVVPPGAALFAMDVGGKNEILAPAPRSVADRLKAGDIVSYQYGPVRGQARVTGLAERVSGVDAATVRFDLLTGTAPAGAGVQLRLPLGTVAKAACVPLSAVLTDRTGHRTVLTVAENGSTRAVPVEIVAITASGALVKGALEPGQSVVASGGEFLKAGDRVRPLAFVR